MARRFLASVDTIARDLAAVLVRMDASRARLESGGKLSQASARLLARSGVSAMGGIPDLLPSSARLTFVRGGKQYSFTCATYLHPLDNMRAAQRAVSMLWGIYDDYGVSNGVGAGDGAAFDALFGAASEALARVALGDGIRPWWQMLGVPPDADRATIEAAHRHLIMVNHPDKGGDSRVAGLVNAARDEGLRQRAAGR